MRVAHLADLHLGMTQFQATLPSGVNRREADIGQTFTRAVDRIIALAPDLVVVGGDIFHRSKPSNSAIVHARRQFERITSALPRTSVCLVAGNHDLARAGDGGDILPILATIDRLFIADRLVQRFQFGDVSVLAVPDAPGVRRSEMRPRPGSRYNLLLMHGEVQGMPRAGGTSKDEISQTEISDEFDVTALGHFHSAHEIRPRCWYSGSLDYCSSNPWPETTIPKGFILWDLAAETHEFIPVEPSRRFIDLPPIDAKGMEAEQLDQAIRDAAQAQDLTGCVVRLVVNDVDKLVDRALDQKSLKAVQRGTLNFQIVRRRPEYVESALSMMVRGVDTPGARAKTVEERTREKLEGRELAPDVDRGDLITLAMKMLDAAKELRPDAEREPDLSAAARQQVA